MEGICETCGKNCKNCVDKLKCNQCLQGFSLSNGRCSIGCEKGYKFSGNSECEVCSSDSNSPNCANIITSKV